MAASKTKVSLKLLIDKNKNKVLFAEAGKDFVDFLFNLLALPVGTVISLLSKQSMVGSLGNLYESVETLSSTYMQPNTDKNSLLKPKTISSYATDAPLLLAGAQSSDEKTFVCRNIHQCAGHVSNDPTLKCPTCKYLMDYPVEWVVKKVADTGSGDESSGGYVKGVVTYMVMDDLVVQPMSTISSITMLNKFNVKEVGILEEKVVDLGMTEGLKLLKASLHSSMVLTTVFLGKPNA